MNNKQNEKQNIESLTEKIISQIDSEKIKPNPKWQFILKEDMYWIFWALSVIIGAGAVTGIMYRIGNSGLKYYEVTHDNFVSFAYDTLPLVWIVILLVIVILSYLNIRKTNKGYKYPLLLVLCASVGASSIIGNFMYVLGAGPVFDREMAERFPLHRSAFVMEKEKWVKPEKGLLAGSVVIVDDDGQNVIVEDFTGHRWVVSTTEMTRRDIEVLNSQNQIRMVGLPATTTDTFYACFVFPWELPLPIGQMKRQKNILDGEPRMFLKFKFDEREDDLMRMNNCRGVRPYDVLQKIRGSQN